MDPLLIADSACNKPYDLETLNSQALGGTEATVVRIAEKLGATRPVVVHQHNRRETSRSANVTYAPLSNQSGPWHAIIVLRNPALALEMKEKFNNTPVWLWQHDLATISLMRFLKSLANQNIGIITVSDFLKQQIIDLAKLDPYLSPLPNIVRIYNPIDDQLSPDATPFDRHKLAFISSPHKGLDYTLSVFKIIQERHPQFELIVTNPGYYQPDFKLLNVPNVRYLGNLRHADNMRMIRSALCLFFLNHVFPETFGLVFAEANAVGTPVLTHPLGAAPEVLTNPEQLIDTHDIEAVETRLLQWHQGSRPKVSGDERFRLSAIARQWDELSQGYQLQQGL